jgi:hypothetical protein
MTGLLFFTEWVELGVFLGFHTEFEIPSKFGQWLWNWGDNFLYLPLQDERMWGFFKAAWDTSQSGPPP